MLKVKTTRRNVRRSVSPPSTSREGDEADLVGPTSRSEGMIRFFDAESASAVNKPWLRLERGLRLQRFRTFAEEYPGLSKEEKDSLYKTLIKANDAKILNTKQQISYEEGKIQTIRGLRMTRVGDEAATFRIDMSRPVTKKRGKDDVTTTVNIDEEVKEVKESKK